MDRKKTQATASATTEKHGEKKDENFLSKTAHSIRDKVHEFTDDVKEKTHQLTHSHDAKKNKKDKTEKKTGAASKTSPKPRTASKKDSGSDSDDEDDSPSVPPAKRDNQREANKPDASGSKPAATLSTSSKFTTDKPTLTNKPSDDRKDNAAAAASSSSAKPATAKPSNSSSNKDSKASTDKPDKTADSGQPTNNKDRIHISLDGVSTVDDLLDRIDEAVERANIIVENNPSKVSVNLQKTLSAPVPSPVDLEKKPTERIKNKEEDNKDGPIRINYNEIQNLEDLLLSIEDQPGHRKILLENAPNNSGSTPVQKLLKSPGNVPLAPANSLASDASFSSAAAAKSEDPSAGPKSILKTSQDPSSLDTSTKTSSFQNDQVHVNVEVEGGQVVNNLLDRIIDDAVHAVPTAVSIESPSEKRHAPQAPHQNEFVARTSQKREAPKATSLPHNHGENTTSATGFQYPNISSISTTESAHKEGKPDEKDASDWI